MAAFCEHGNEPSGCIKYAESLDWLRNDYIFRMDSAPWSKLMETDRDATPSYHRYSVYEGRRRIIVRQFEYSKPQGTSRQTDLLHTENGT